MENDYVGCADDHEVDVAARKCRRVRFVATPNGVREKCPHRHLEMRNDCVGCADGFRMGFGESALKKGFQRGFWIEIPADVTMVTVPFNTIRCFQATGPHCHRYRDSSHCLIRE